MEELMPIRRQIPAGRWVGSGSVAAARNRAEATGKRDGLVEVTGSSSGTGLGPARRAARDEQFLDGPGVAGGAFREASITLEGNAPCLPNGGHEGAGRSWGTTLHFRTCA